MLSTRTAQAGLGAARLAISHMGGQGPAAIVLTRAVSMRAAAPFYATTRQFSLVTDKRPKPEPSAMRTTKPMFPGPSYSDEELMGIQVGHRDTKSISDTLAFKLVRGARVSVDWLTGVTDKKPLTTSQYNTRILFLESIAAVPGMVAAVHRHLASLRFARRDQGWIKTLLEEAHNERMHLLTWMKIAEPNLFMRAMFIAAQGVFFNVCFFARWISPNFFHRFVGYLEEEAIHTYTRLEKEIEGGKVPRWSNPEFPVPEIAIEYWNIPKEKRNMLWLTRYIKADEAGHRGVNHTLANLNHDHDPNPFEPDSHHAGEVPNPILRIEGFERHEVIKGVDETTDHKTPVEPSRQA